jgi:hypothetical protein
MAPLRRLWIALGVLLVVGAGFAWITRSSDEEKIRAQLTRLAAALHMSEGANPVLRVANLRSEFSGIFDESPHVSVPELTMPLPDDRRGLADAAAQLTSFVQRVDVDFEGTEIKLDDAHTSAKVDATATLSTDDGRARRTTRAVTFLMWKRGDAWRISSVHVWPADEPTR